MFKKTLNSLMGFLVKNLFVANLWIIIFNQIVLFLNFFFPPVLKDRFYRPAAAWPEPFEMPLYLLLSFLFVIAIWLYNKMKFQLKLSLPVLIVVFIFLVLLFTSMLGVYPMAFEFYPYLPRDNPQIYQLTFLIFMAFLVFFIIEVAIIKQIFSKKKWFVPFIYGLIGFVIAVLVFEPRFPISAHEYGYFFGPIWEVVKGKTLFTHIHTDYGFYSTLLFALLYKLRLFQFTHLPIYVWIMFVVQYFLSFYLIYKISKSISLALIGLFSLIVINYFSFFVLPITITQYSAMRRITSLLLIFLLYRSKKINSPVLLIAFSLFCFWIVDTGVSMILAFCLTLFHLLLLKWMSLKKVVLTSLLLFVAIGGVFLFINLGHIIFGYVPIDPRDILSSLRQHAGSGLTMLPMQPKSYFWIVIFVYFSTITFVFRSSGKALGEEEKGNNTTLLLLANLILFNSLYFVGRSADANLYDISVLVVLNIFLLISANWQNIAASRIRILIYCVLFFFFIVVPGYNRRFHLTEFLLFKYEGIKKGNFYRPEANGLIRKSLFEDAQMIKKYIPEEKVLILSREDTYLLILANKSNYLYVNPQSAIDTVSEMQFAIRTVTKECPKKIAVDCTVYDRCPNYESLSSKSLFMAPHILAEVEKGCRTKYQPVVCNSHLCIAEKKE